jgi:arginyl-tRNA synthetase
MATENDTEFDIERQLNDLLVAGARNALGNQAEGFDPAVRPSKHAHFQANGVLGLAKQLGTQPRELAQQIVDAIQDDRGTLASIEIAGPGFINLTLSSAFLSSLATDLARTANLGLYAKQNKRRYVLDYSGPNIAKSMHVGHLRTTVIGDCIARMLEATGQAVIRQNHLGDWGTQFGMLIEHMVDSDDPEETAKSAVDDLDGFYRAARQRFESDGEFADRSRARVVKLQSGDKDTISKWETLVATSKSHFGTVYDRLGVTLSDSDDRGESFYNDMLDDVVADLESKDMLKVSQGALCAYPEGFVGRDGEPFPLIVRKSDGGYGYVATDLATVRYSVDQLGANSLVYVTDARQAQHFYMVFAVARQAGWITDDIETVHVGYGMVMGPDNKPFKSRSGETVQLIALLDEAVERAQNAMSERSSDLDDEAKAQVARSVGIGAIKWFDLKNEHTNNYAFDFDRMLAFNGNTGPYVQYASTRAKAVMRKAGENIADADVNLVEPAEIELGIHLPAFASAVLGATESYEPHQLCNYLYELADKFTKFYETCPVLTAPDDATRASRLVLCVTTARVLDRGLQLLGIEPVDRM